VATDRPWHVTLEVTHGPHAGETFTFAQHDTFVVGRSQQAHFCLPEKDPFFSRLHFLVEVNPPLCRLMDLNSHNGTLVNGQKAKIADLKDGDEIRAGTTAFRVRIVAGAADASSAPVTDDFLELILEEFAQRRRAGENPDAGEYIRRYPQLDGVLQLALQAEGSGFSLDASAMPSIPGYQLTAVLGRGGMGIVYKAIRASDDSEVALKTIKPKLKTSKESADRFLREAMILSRLQHAHIVPFVEMGQTPELLYFAMEFVAGTDAHRLVRDTGPLPIGRATRIIRQVLSALVYAHGEGIVHRDLKPANVLLTSDADGDLARVADFGLARAYLESPISGLTISREVLGTPAFMPPEQIVSFRTVRPAGDQYAAAATLYFLLAGVPPYSLSKSPQEFYKCILQEDPRRIDTHRADVPGELVQIVHRGLERDPDRRFPDIQTMHEALAPFAL
jgi:serine/threonine-protein kinase